MEKKADDALGVMLLGYNGEVVLTIKPLHLKAVLEKHQMNLSLLQPISTSSLTWYVLVETLEQGQIAAWVAEFPESKVTAESQEAAIAALETLLNKRMATIEVIPFQLSSQNSENPWFQLCGILKEDASFAEWSDRFWTQKQQSIEDDEVISVEESLRVM
jgi:hypothetical protein